MSPSIPGICTSSRATSGAVVRAATGGPADLQGTAHRVEALPNSDQALAGRTLHRSPHLVSVVDDVHPTRTRGDRAPAGATVPHHVGDGLSQDVSEHLAVLGSDFLDGLRQHCLDAGRGKYGARTGDLLRQRRSPLGRHRRTHIGQGLPGQTFDVTDLHGRRRETEHRQRQPPPQRRLRAPLTRTQQEVDDAEQGEEPEHQYPVGQGVLGTPQLCEVWNQPEEKCGTDNAPHQKTPNYWFPIRFRRPARARERADGGRERPRLLTQVDHVNRPQTRLVSRRNRTAAPTMKTAAHTTTLAIAEGVNPVPVSGSRASSAMP